MTLAADYSFAHPKPEKFKTAGYDVILRYLSHTPEKNLTHPEAKALREAGLSIGLVWETTADRALGGAGAAEEDRVDAEAMAADVGYPKTCVIFYAVDKDVDPSDVNDYFAGVAKTATHPVGVYGSLRVCEGMREEGHVTYLWQTEAWSGTEVSKHAHVYQRVKATKDIPANCDEDVVLKPLPLWAARGEEPMRPVKPVTPAKPTKEPVDAGGADELGPMAREAVKVVLKALRGRTGVAKADRVLLSDLNAATAEALQMTVHASHESAMVR